MARRLAKRNEARMASLMVWSDGDGVNRKRVGSKGYRGGIFAGFGEESRSGGYLRRGSGRGVSRVYGECFAQANSAGATLPWALHGELLSGGKGYRGGARLGTKRRN